MNSGTFGAVATGAGAVFGAHALTRTSATHTSRISFAEAVSAPRTGRTEAVAEAGHIRKILAQTIEQAARHVGDDGYLVVAGLVQHDARMAVDAGDPLAIGGAVRVEGQRDADHVESQPGGNGFDQLIYPLARQCGDQQRRRILILQAPAFVRRYRVALVV